MTVSLISVMNWGLLYGRILRMPVYLMNLIRMLFIGFRYRYLKGIMIIHVYFIFF